VKADRLAEALGVENLWVKNDAVNFPTLSFKDRVVAVALSKAKEFGLTTVGCASTGNLANSVAANAAAAGLEAYVFIPSDLEQTKILATSVYGAKVVAVNGTYDEVNRLATQVAFKYGWGFVKRQPPAVLRRRLEDLRLRDRRATRLAGAATRRLPDGRRQSDRQDPQGVRRAGEDRACRKWQVRDARRPGGRLQPDRRHGEEQPRLRTARCAGRNTIAKSLAIGDPADGYFAAQLIRSSGGWSEDATDDEIREAMLLLAKTEGIFAEDGRRP